MRWTDPPTRRELALVLASLAVFSLAHNFAATLAAVTDSGLLRAGMQMWGEHGSHPTLPVVVVARLALPMAMRIVASPVLHTHTHTLTQEEDKNKTPTLAD